jgi:hypothetical protein
MKFHLDRLKKKYKNIPVKGQTYRDLIKEIIAVQSENISKKVIKISDESWRRALKKIETKEKKINMVGIEEVLPKRSIHLRKAADTGKLLTDTLRDKLTKDLRQVIDQFSDKGEMITTTRRGARTGRIKKEAIEEFEKKITETFQTYTKKDPDLKMPKNIHTIAVTEVRTTINEIKENYSKQLLSKNPDIRIKKKWIHNKSLSKNPRIGHQRQERRKPIDMDTYFHVPLIVRRGGRLVNKGVTNMRYPHDPTAPPEQVINCNCDIDYIFSRKRKK